MNAISEGCLINFEIFIFFWGETVHDKEESW
jgi:hypothetical protein